MRNVFLFLKRIRILLLFLLLETFAIFATFSKNNYHNSLAFQLFSSVNNKIMSIRTNITSFFNLRNENLRLIKENMNLRRHLTESFIISDQHVFIKNDTLYRQEFEYMTSSIINYTVNYQDNYITLDKGEAQGVETGMGVFAPSGIVGVVSNVSQNYCLVQSILNSKIKVSTQIKNAGVIGTSYWDGKNYAYGMLKDIPVHVKPNIGDTLITSAYSSIFPEGIPVGYITNFNTDNTRAFYSIQFKIAADFGNLTSVYIIRNLIKGELDNLERLKKGKEYE